MKYIKFSFCIIMLLLFCISFSKNNMATEINTETSTQFDINNLPKYVSEDEITTFLNNSVYLGDSIVMFFYSFTQRKEVNNFCDATFLFAKSMRLNDVLQEVSRDSIHPTYMGQKRLAEDAILLCGKKNVFIYLGMCDLIYTDINTNILMYQSLIDRIKAKIPDVKIHIISLTYIVRNSGRSAFQTNDGIRLFNYNLKVMCENNNIGFIDMASPYSNQNGDMDPEYSSDSYFHIKSQYYSLWENTLRGYARQYLSTLK
ncbi:MAG: GDSL-type esterase/lipase family protein [Eubacteriales bacterium]|nr:GDSL-type esterase/lipase family protein [Eubacteriales bacterium]